MLLFRKYRSHAPDTSLIDAYRRSSDAFALEALLGRYAHLVYGVCQKYLKNEADSKDATMEVFEKVIDALKTHDITNFKVWLYAVAKNHCLMRLRDTKRRNISIINHQEIEKKCVENPTFMHLTHENQDRVRDLNEAIGRLNQAQRTCVCLFYLEKKSYKDIAATTGYDMKKVKSHIQNGKRNLRKLLITSKGDKNVNHSKK